MEEGQSKGGHKCCGCCCDTKRAIIIVEILFGILLNIIGIAISLVTLGIQVKEDPELEEALQDAGKMSSVFYGIGIGVAVVVILGARIYNVWLVGVGILWNIIQTACTIVFTYQDYQDSSTSYPIARVILTITASVLLVYPHSVFIYEVHSGAMGPETYAREKQARCCV